MRIVLWNISQVLLESYDTGLQVWWFFFHFRKLIMWPHMWHIFSKVAFCSQFGYIHLQFLCWNILCDLNIYSFLFWKYALNPANSIYQLVEPWAQPTYGMIDRENHYYFFPEFILFYIIFLLNFLFWKSMWTLNTAHIWCDRQREWTPFFSHFIVFYVTFLLNFLFWKCMCGPWIQPMYVMTAGCTIIIFFWILSYFIVFFCLFFSQISFFGNVYRPWTQPIYGVTGRIHSHYFFLIFWLFYCYFSF